MSELSKQALKVENNMEFPNNNNGQITPSKLRTFNEDMIDSTVNQAVYTSDSASWNAQLAAISASTGGDFTSLNQYTASQDTKNTTLASVTQSLQNQLTNIGSQSGSWDNTSLNVFTQSQETKDQTLSSYTASVDSKFATIGNQSGSWITESETSSFARYDVSNPWSANQNFTNITAVSASFTYVKTTYETASVIYSSGSNQFGDAADDIQTLYGSVRVMNQLTASGLNYPTADNGVKSFIQTDGAGNLSLQYVDTIWESVRAGENVAKGTPLYISGSQGANPIVYAADASNPTKMPVTFVAGQAYTAGKTYPAIVLGLIEGMDLTGYTAGQTVYVAEGGGWTTSLPSGSNSITQVLGVVTKGGSGGKGLVLNPGPAQLPTLQTGFVWVGNGNNRPVAVTTSSLVTSATDITALNQFTASQENKNATLSNVTASLNQFTASQYVSNSFFATTGSNTFTGTNIFSGLFSITDSPSVTNYIITGSEDNGNTRNVFAVGKNIQPLQNSGSNISYDGFVLTARTGSQTSPFSASVSEIGVDVNRGPSMYWLPNREAGAPNIISFGLTGVTQSVKIQTEALELINSGFNSNPAAGQRLIIPIKSGSAGQVLTDVDGNGILKFTTPTSGGDLTSLNAFTASQQELNLTFATTGSNSFNGNQTITGSLLVSGNTFVTPAIASNNAGYPLVFISASTITKDSIDTLMYNPATNVLQVSGSNGFGALTPTAVNYTSVTASIVSSFAKGLVSSQDSTGAPATFKAIQISANPSVTGNATLLSITNPSILTPSSSVGGFIAPIQFQDRSGFTDGRVTFTTPVVLQQPLTASLTEGYVWAGGAGNISKLVATSSFGGGGGAAFPYTGDATISGSLQVTGSFRGFVNNLSVVSTTASIDMNNGNFFTLNLPTASTTYIEVTNIKAGQTINLQVSQSSASTGSVTFAPNIKFAGGFDYTATAITGALDLVSFVSFDTNQIIATSVKNLL